MPYKPSDAKRFTKKASTPKRQRQWKHVYDSMRAAGKSEGSAIKGASSQVRKSALSRIRKP